MNFIEKSYENLSTAVIDKFRLRGIKGYYCSNKEDALKMALSLMPSGSSIAWGGSESIKEIGLIDAVKTGDYTFYDRAEANTPEEKSAMYAKHVTSDFFLCSSNAITYDGKLINIDGTGNRTACMIHGPKNVIVIAGMNKVVATEEAAINRASNVAAPPNGLRLSLNTPCTNLGRCTDCLVDDCMCCATVIIRKSKPSGRIIVILVGENLGY